MSRRKQSKPQHLRSEVDAPRTRTRARTRARSGPRCNNGIAEAMEREEAVAGGHSPEETHVCDKCCAEFITWTELSGHQKGCTEDPLVLIVKDNERMPVGPSPVPSVAFSDLSAAESTGAGFDLGETLVTDNDSLDHLEEGAERDEAMELEQWPEDKCISSSNPHPPDSDGSYVSAGIYSMPNTNVTLEILHSTRVAVAQFSQGISSRGAGGKAASAAIPVILEHLLALQKQQVHQLQLIEQICSQVAVMNRQPVQTALNPVSGAPSQTSSPFPPQAIMPPSVLPLSGTMPSAVNGQAAVSLSSFLQRSQSPPSQTICGQSTFRDVTRTSAPSEDPSPTLYSGGGGGSHGPLCDETGAALLPRYPSSHSQTLNSPSPLSLGQNCLPFLPQSPPSTVIFPNPLASIAATANALDPLAALMKHRRGTLSHVSLFEPKPSPEEPFFKHKCRFCAKVFGSDSALQIHLRSHTGERPFKCNICGNRFSTKGNLKVHFQRHKDKYPHVQMNPYPVPEYLDNLPTNSGIPYGMSIPPEKPVSSWLDSKPVVATVAATMALPLSSSDASVGGSNEPVSVTPSVKSSCHPAPFDCGSLSPNRRGSEVHFSPVSESPRSNLWTGALNKPEGLHIPQNCSLGLRANPGTEATSSRIPSLTRTPETTASASPFSDSPPLLLSSGETGFPTGDFLDSMQTSETSKLQQLVESIDKKITDPNQCTLCHRVLSCQSALKMHQRIHTGERPYRCKVCGRAFTTKGNLKAHVGVHRERPPVPVQHSCPLCHERFTNAVILQQHIRMHMVGPVPDAALLDGMRETDSRMAVDERNCDSLSSDSNELTDDVSMEEDREKEENTDPAKAPLLARYAAPTSPAVVSSAAALDDQVLSGSVAGLNHAPGVKPLTNGFNAAQRCSSESCSPNASESSCSPCAPASPVHGRGTMGRPSRRDDRPQVPLAASVKSEQPDSPVSAPAAQELRGMRADKLCVKEENPYASFLPGQERGQNVPSPATSTPSGAIKTEVKGHHQANGPSEVQQPPFSPQACASVGTNSLPSAVPPRRTPKQHNCNVCGKNFSSGSALQIHERTHTGEKPFVCTICGRAFTTKGNLKVHMGTHMWNNAPARRGRRLSVENPMALLGGEAVKFGAMLQKDLAARAMNVDPAFWSRYATAIANNLATKNNEISVIQNRGISQLHPLAAGMDRLSTTGSPVASRSKMDLGAHRHFSMLIDDGKEIGIN
ncbi:sal-like protein 3b [Brachionichthys hirsutus]|uniref:sal-like protein 3b n=1 Tax=Brachionichthys hirsutus TaxID=412623 RepID=UPI0036043FDB